MTPLAPVALIALAALAVRKVSAARDPYGWLRPRSATDLGVQPKIPPQPWQQSAGPLIVHPKGKWAKLRPRIRARSVRLTSPFQPRPAPVQIVNPADPNGP